LILHGTAILGESRYAILQDSGSSPGGRPVQGQTNQLMRFKTGDSFEGFRVSEIRDRNVVFSNGPARIELALDYFREVESVTASAPPAAQVRPTGSAPARGQPSPLPLPRVVPQIPRRERLPQHPSR
jgi:hypothetical protein